MRHFIPFFVLFAVSLPGRAEEPPEDGALLYHGAKRTVATVKDLEFTRMLTHILEKGPDMRPGDGWFKPSESRYSWKWFADRHGQKQDGRVTVKDFKGPPEMFRRLDRDRDGVLTAADFDWSDRSPRNQQLGMAARWIRMNSEDGRTITKAEWDAIFKKAAQGKDRLTAEDVRAILNPPRPPGPPPDMPSQATLLKGLFTAELGSPFEGPKLGDSAPDFTLADLDGKPVSLSQFCDKKPVALIFGSFT
jgi:hypothetical protein